MLSIQECAQQIYSNNLRKIYFFTGEEYGVKTQYILQLKSFYEEIEERESLEELIKSFSKKTLIPRSPKLYICRYDSSFIKNLDADLAKSVRDSNIVGTVVCIYQDQKSESKLDKYLGEFTVRINSLTPEIQSKHLLKDFPFLSQAQVSEIIKVSSGYYQASLNCKSLSYLPEMTVRSFSKSDIRSIFRRELSSSSQRFKTAIASRDLKKAVSEIDNYKDDLSTLLYDVLSTCLEIHKVIEKGGYGDSFVVPYIKLWDLSSAKAMFDYTFEQLKLLRNVSTYPPYNSLMYVCLLLKFKLS